MPGDKRFDYVLVGGGLQNGLIALAVLAEQPGARIAIVERDRRLGGNHTWCFHAGDVPARARPWVEPLICHRWRGYDVTFPGLQRRLDAEYCGFTSERLAEVVGDRIARAPGAQLWLGTAARSVSAHEVELDSGERLAAAAVIDARGPSADVPPARAGYQLFLGLEVELTSPHGLDRPQLMDATVPQLGGFRFFYLLPFGDRRLLVEDTYFADSPALDRPAIRERIAHYLAGRGLAIDRVVREEEGVLPLPWSGDRVSDRPPLRAGYGGGWFHPATGYSFPVAIRLADAIAHASPERICAGALADLAREQQRQVAYCHRLNRMLFSWFAPGDRWHVFERFYRLPEPLIRRFYALELTAGDRARILLGRPPRGLSLRARLSSMRRALP